MKLDVLISDLKGNPEMKNLIAIVSLLALLVGCSGSKSSSPSAAPVTFSAHTNSSTIVGRAVGGSLTTAVTTASISDYLAKLIGINTAVAGAGQQISTYDFLAINSSGQVAKIFNYSFPIFGIKTTTNYLIVAGDFISPLDATTGQAMILDAAGKPLQCYLYAIKKTAQGNAGDTTCLSKVQVGSYSLTITPINAHYAHLGFDVLGSSVYFTDWANGVLYKWTEGVAAPTTIFSAVLGIGAGNGVGLDDVFVNQASGNICVLESALSTSVGLNTGSIYCGTDAGLSITIQGSATNYILAETRMLNTYLVTTSQYIDMTTLAVQSRIAHGSNGGLPSSDRNVVNTASSGTVQIAYAWSLTYMDASATTCMVASINGLTNAPGNAAMTTTADCPVLPQKIPNVYFQSMYGLGNYAWTYGTSAPYDLTTGIYLAKFDLTTMTLDSTNHMPVVGMTSISSLNIDGLSGLLVVTGKNAAGATITASIDATGAISANPTVSTPVDNRVTF
jgi:hypothetical protein